MNPLAEIAVGVLIFCLYLVILILPAREAKRRRCKHAEAIRNLCFLGILIPLCWIAALIWCYVDDRLPPEPDPRNRKLTAAQAEAATRRAKEKELGIAGIDAELEKVMSGK